MPRNEMGIDQNRNRNYSESDARPTGRRGDDGGGGGVEEAMLRSNCNKTNSTVHSHTNGNNKKRGRIRLRHESTDTDASDISATLECQRAPDGGFGWVVVAAAFLVNMIADGVTFSFGVFYVEFNKYFGESKAKTAWIGSLLASMPLLSGPIASSLADRFGCRRVTIAGSLLATIGFVLSSYANSVEMLFLTFGVITGFGLSLCYVAAVVIVAYYFEQRRSLATGLSVCGGGIGTFIFAPLTAELINIYGWRGTTLLLAGAFLNLSVCGALMRDLEWTRKKVHKTHTPPPSVDLVPSEISSSLKKERLCNSAICIPTFVQEQEHQNFLQRTNFRTSVNFHSFHNYNQYDHNTNNVTCNNGNSVSSRSQHSFPNGGDNLSCGVNPSVATVTNGDLFNLNLSNNTSTPTMKPNNNNLCNNNVGVGVNHNASMTTNATFVPLSLNNDGLSSMEPTIASTNPLTSINDSGTNLTTVLVSNNLTNQLPSQTPSNIQNHQGDNTWISKARHSLTYRGAVLSLKRYRLRPASSCPDIISVATADDRSTHEWKAVMGDVVKWLRGVCDWEHLSSSRFILFILSNLLLYMWYDVPYVYLQDAALQNNYSEDNSSYLISIVGFFNMIGNIMLGYVGDKPWSDAIVVYGVCMAVCGASIILLPWLMVWNYTSLAIGCAIFGLTIAANYSLTSVILIHVVSLERFANAYGLLLLVQGIGNLTGPPIAGVIYDLTGTSSWSFLVAGGGVFASSILLCRFPFPCIYRRK